MSLFSEILQFVFTGLTIGSIYSMVGLGFNIIYNATTIINLAQGEFVMFGGLIMVFLTVVLKLPLFIGFPLTVIVVTAIGALFECFAIHPLRNASLLTLIIVTIAASILFRGIAMFIWGKDPYTLPPFTPGSPVMIGGAVIMLQTFWVLGTTLAIVVLTSLFFGKTIVGKAMSACSFNPMAASLLGIHVRKMILISFVLSAGLGAVAGIVITPISLMDYDRGPMLAVKGFCAAVLGGLGVGYGAVLGGFIVGLLESLTAGLIHSGFKDAVALVILLFILCFKPSGIFGSEEVSKIKKF
ncbi:MAG TPA: branched-chain amino acid ABC transporter permease [Thermodesulfobacteriota bacterium]|jgi:branched-chain amino acid transport system permease protein|nr:branched-chain amino acid ABC transporter permease [Thermodesulfobacteriota bacterium]